MNNRRFILVGAKISEKNSRGGVGTLSNALADYAKRQGYVIKIIDTSKKPFAKYSFIQNLKLGIARIFFLIKITRKNKYTGVIIFSGAGWGFYERIFLSLICRLINLPSIFFIVDGRFFSIRDSFFIFRLFISTLLKIPNFFAASGQNWVALLKDLGVEDRRIFLIHYWLSNSYRRHIKPKLFSKNVPINFIFIGWMIKDKGLQEIISAIDALYNKHSFTFTFVGGGPMLQNIRKIVKESNWNSRIFVKGWLPNKEKEQALLSSDIFVLPSYAEGFPMTLIEAMFSGLPAICTDVGGVSDSLLDGINGILISPKNSQELMNAMEYYMKNPSVIKKHSIKAIQVARENHDPDSNCKMLFNRLINFN